MYKYLDSLELQVLTFMRSPFWRTTSVFRVTMELGSTTSVGAVPLEGQASQNTNVRFRPNPLCIHLQDIVWHIDI